MVEITLTEEEYNLFIYCVNHGHAEPFVMAHIMEQNGARIHVLASQKADEVCTEDLEEAAEELSRDSEVI